MSLVYKAVANSGASLDFVMSDETVDRYGDIVDAKGWILNYFKKNPIALFGHSAAFPIGTWSNVRVEGGKLLGKLNLAARGTSARIDELIGLVEQGILRAVSVGFIPRKSEPIDKDKPYDGRRYTEHELLECSLVPVPANPSAVSLAKSMNVSSETMSLAFGENAETVLRDVSLGENAATSPQNRGKSMTTLAQRIADAQNSLNVKRDRLVELTSAETLDVTAIEELNSQIETSEKELNVLKTSEANIGADLANRAAPAIVTVPAAPRRPLGNKDTNGLDLLVRSITARGIAHFGDNMTLDKTLEQRYPGNEAVAIIAKADQTIGTTSVSGWASELVQTAWADFLQALTGYSIYPALRDKGIGLSFDGYGTVTIPSRTAGGAGGGFVAEGQPIRVGRITTAATTMTPRKLGVIVPFSKELAKRSTPHIEGLVRQAILEDTAVNLDSAILDAVASSTARPAGLLNGISALGNGYGGGDYQAVIEDFAALLSPFVDANAVDNITIIMNPKQGLRLSMMPGPVGDPNWLNRIKERLTIVESTHATAGRLIALRNSDFATALGDAPEFDISEQATIHMEDATPLEIVSGTGPTTADPVRSLWQTASVGVRMLMDVSWKMRRAGMVQWIDTTTW